MTVAAVFVMLIKLIFRSRLTAGMHCAAWWILFIQLIFCIGNVSIPARTSIYNIVPDAGAVLSQTENVQTAAIDIRGIAVWIYVAGAVAMALWFTLIFLSFRKKISHFESVDDPATLDVLNGAKMKLGVRANIILRRGELAQMTGNIVILPDGYSYDEQRHILLHELCHYKNKDNLKLWAAMCMLCLNWFNPVIWYAFSIYRNDIEMYCDENVMKVSDSKKEYARILIKTAAARTRFVPGATAVSGGKREMKKRVRNIATWRKKKRVWVIVAAVLCASSCCICLTDAVSVAVENTAEIVKAPEPDKLIPQTAAPAQETEADEETEPVQPTAYAAEETKPPERTAQRSTPEPKAAAESQGGYEDTYEQQYEEPVYEEPEQTADTAPQEDEPEVYPDLGTPESVSANGNKETYSLEDGRTAVLHYDGDTLETGYIISGDSVDENEE